MKKDYETPRVEFFRVEEFVFCSNGTGWDPDGGFGFEEEEGLGQFHIDLSFVLPFNHVQAADDASSLQA